MSWNLEEPKSTRVRNSVWLDIGSKLASGGWDWKLVAHGYRFCIILLGRLEID